MCLAIAAGAVADPAAAISLAAAALAAAAFSAAALAAAALAAAALALALAATTLVLAISRITPGAVSCRFTLVMSTSSGGLRVAVTASATLTENLRMAVTASSPTKSWCEFLSRMNAGEIVTSIETVALYPISVTPRMAPRRRGRKRIVARFLTMQQTVLSSNRCLEGVSGVQNCCRGKRPGAAGPGRVSKQVGCWHNS